VSGVFLSIDNKDGYVIILVVYRFSNLPKTNRGTLMHSHHSKIYLIVFFLIATAVPAYGEQATGLGHTVEPHTDKSQPHAGQQGRAAGERRSVIVCSVPHFSGTAAWTPPANGRLINFCRLRNNGEPLSVETNSEFWNDVLGMPFVAGRQDLCRGVRSEPPSSESAVAAWRREIVRRLKDHCARKVCQNRRLGDNCSLAQQLIDFKDEDADPIWRMIRNHQQCEATTVHQLVQ